MKWLLLFILFKPFLTLACLPNEIHIREQWIDTYTKEDGTHVSAHVRSEHCREIRGDRYFQDSNTDEIKGLKTKFKAWTDEEKKLLQSEIANLPNWLKRYKLSKIVRANEEIRNPNNPAMTIPATKTLIIFDKFFSTSKRREVIVHEMAHIAAWDIDPIILKSFFLARDWKYQVTGKILPPAKAMIPDSKLSPSEDFANSVELYYSERQRLKDFNSKSFQILEEIIKNKESNK